MKTTLRYQSQLLTRRSYRPGRKYRITFKPSTGSRTSVGDLGKMRMRLPELKPLTAVSA